MTTVTDPGYGPNGERLDPVGAVAWQAQAPPITVPEGDDVSLFFALGVVTLPFVDAEAPEGWTHVYLGGAS